MPRQYLCALSVFPRRDGREGGLWVCTKVPTDGCRSPGLVRSFLSGVGGGGGGPVVGQVHTVDSIHGIVAVGGLLVGKLDREMSPFCRVMLWRRKGYYRILEVDIFECLAGTEGVVRL